MPLDNFYEYNCPVCGGGNAIKKGIKKRMLKEDAPIIYCFDCEKFSVSDCYSFTHYPPWVISEVVDFFVSGINSRKICRNIKRKAIQRGCKNIHITKQTIFNTVENICEILLEYERILPVFKKNPVWELDETCVWIEKEDLHWMEVVYDVDSKYVIASKVVRKNDQSASLQTIELARITAKYLPKTIRTDGNKAHKINIKKNYRKVKHDYKTKKENIAQINYVESYNSKQRDETGFKRRKKFKSKFTAQIMADLYRFQWNFLRPNINLKGKVPADAVGIPFHFETWDDLILHAINYINWNEHFCNRE